MAAADRSGSLNRRELMQAAGAAAAALAAQRSLFAADEPEKYPPAIDAHTHFYDPTRKEGVPWPGKDDKKLYRTVLPAEFKKLTQPFNVQGTIIVEASPWIEDNQWLLDLAANDPFIVGIVGNLDPRGAKFAEHLARFAKNSKFRGIRINHDALKKGLDDAGFVANLKLLVDHDLALDVNGGPEMPGDVAALAAKLRELRIVINHAANQPIDGKAVQPAWLAGMKKAAQNPQVYCKVSALVEATGKRAGDAPTDLEFYRPVLDALRQTFDLDRLIYASNWPVSELAATYATVHAIVYQYVRAMGRAALENFFSKNARRAYAIS